MRFGAAFVIAFVCVSISAGPEVRAQSGAPDQVRHLAGQAALERGDLDEASRQWLLGLNEAQQSGALDRLSSSQLDLATIYTIRWQFPEASAALESARTAKSSADAAVRFQTDFVVAGYEAATSDLAAAGRDLQDIINSAKTSLGLGEDHPKTATLYSLLGLVELQSEQYAKSGDDLQRALGIFSETYGPEHVETAVARDRYARLLLAEGRYNDALQQAARAVDTARKLGPAGRPVLGDALLTRGLINLASRRLAAAADNLEESLNVARAVFGNQLRTVPCLTALADLSLERGDLAQSLNLINQTLEIYNGNPVPNWLPAVEALRVGAKVAARDQRQRDASAFLDRALQMAIARLSSGSLLAARVTETRGDLAFDAGDTDRAETDYKEAMESRQRLLTPGHPDLARSLIEIAQVSAKRGLPSIAVDSLFKEAINNITLETGNDSFGLIPTLERYVSFLRLQKREQDAEEWDKKVELMVARQE
jgi:tetratricopeptide (TPR) repeat protein